LENLENKRNYCLQKPVLEHQTKWFFSFSQHKFGLHKKSKIREEKTQKLLKFTELKTFIQNWVVFRKHQFRVFFGCALFVVPFTSWPSLQPPCC
jgi:hypothetical protein